MYGRNPYTDTTDAPDSCRTKLQIRHGSAGNRCHRASKLEARRSEMNVLIGIICLSGDAMPSALPAVISSYL